MLCPKCRFEQPEGRPECARCGIVFLKYRAAPDEGREVPAPAPLQRPSAAKELLFHVSPEASALGLAGRAAVLLLLAFWGLKLMSASVEGNAAGRHLLHFVNLPFHEAGHILFSPFGRFMTSLGGSLMQVLVPLACLAAFLWQTRDPFAAAVSLWWLGENLLDLAPYINDARALRLTLIGGLTGREAEYGFHDWEFILRELGWLRYDHFLAQISHALGGLLMLCALAWGGYLLYKNYA